MFNFADKYLTILINARIGLVCEVGEVMGARRGKTGRSGRSYKGVQHVWRGRSGMLVGEVKKGRTGWGVGILGRAGEVGAANVVRKRSVIVVVTYITQ